MELKKIFFFEFFFRQNIWFVTKNALSLHSLSEGEAVEAESRGDRQQEEIFEGN